MGEMKSVLLGIVGLTAIGIAPAVAADLPAKAPYTKAPVIAPIYNWSGFYIGLNGGGGTSTKCWDLVAASGFTIPTVLAEGCHHPTGGTFGGQIGYRWQTTNWVYGIEAQGNWADFRGNNLNNLDGVLFRAGLTDESRIRAFGLFTGQFGFAWNNFMFYTKSGFAVVADKYNTFVASSGLLIDSARETRWGGTAGVGFEYGLTPSLSLGFEYDHLFMGSRNVDAFAPTGVFSATDRIRQDVDIATVRLNYHFNGPLVAKF
jgi:outer membrane immunogenic protein